MREERYFPFSILGSQYFLTISFSCLFAVHIPSLYRETKFILVKCYFLIFVTILTSVRIYLAL